MENAHTKSVQRYPGLLNMEEERQKRGELNQNSTKENTLICIRAGQASVTYNSWFSHYPQGLL